jgi:hypothetical protein
MRQLYGCNLPQISALQNWEEAGIVIAPRLHSPEDINGREELKIARKLGEAMR